jgi:hypothetical protein
VIHHIKTRQYPIGDCSSREIPNWEFFKGVEFSSYDSWDILEE